MKAKYILSLLLLLCCLVPAGIAESSLDEMYPDGERVLVIGGGRAENKDFSNEPYPFPDSRTEELMRVILGREHGELITYKAVSDVSEFRLYGQTMETALEYISVLKYFPWLRTVEIIDCGLKEVPKELAALPITSLWLNGNDLRDISELGNMKNLTLLELTGNNFITDYSALSELENLHSISLSLFSASDVSSLAGCKKLRNITLIGNFTAYEGSYVYSPSSYCVPFEDASFFDELPHLEEVSISHFSEISETAFEQIESSTTSAEISIKFLYDGQPRNLYEDLKNGLNGDWRGEGVLHGLNKEDILAFYEKQENKE